MPERTRLVGAVLVREGRILLGRRNLEKRTCPGLWDVIGGHIEAGESYEEGLRRELREEVGISPTSFRVLDRRQLTAESEIQTYRVDAWDGGEPRLTNDEHVSLAWFTIAEACALADLASHELVAVLRGLDAVAQGIVPSDLRK
jgi:8-oxo-dGTP diphosphatase